MRVCLECNEKLVGREDKKFCNDACRNAFNNKINKDSNNLMRNTNNQLRKNYRILSKCNKDNKTKISKQALQQKGFDFQLITSLYTTKNGNCYFFVYNQGYMFLEGDLCLLVKRE